VLTIGGGERVSSNVEGRVLNLARVSCVYGPTSLFVAEPSEVARLAQWPVAVVLHDVWRVEGLPHLVSDLRMPDRKVLAGAQDGVVRPEGKIEPLWDALRDTSLELVPLPLPANFYDPGKPTLSISKRPVLKTGAGSDEGERVWRLQKLAERDPRVSRDAKLLNAEKFGRLTCEACDFSHSDFGMFDAHHPTPLAIGFRTTLPEHLEILCPTCHRRAHREDRLSPLSVRMLREWNVAGRP
jgi:5-methylcytosine-specific restriction protein A